MVSGSTARGDADRWSDVEIGVFWSSRPSRLTVGRSRRPPAPPTYAQVTDEVAGPPWYDHLYLGAQPDGLMVEVVHALTCTTEGLMDATNSCAPPSDPSAHRGRRYLTVEQRRRRGPAVLVRGSWVPY